MSKKHSVERVLTFVYACDNNEVIDDPEEYLNNLYDVGRILQDIIDYCNTTLEIYDPSREKEFGLVEHLSHIKEIAAGEVNED